MLYAPFKNYAEFQEMFGIIHHSNGVKSRKNLILLKYLKTRAIRKLAMSTGDFTVLDIKNMPQLKKYIFERLSQNEDNLKYKVRLINYTFYSDTFETDEREGSCVDGDLNAIRYLKHEPSRIKEYKKKAGKFIKGIILENSFGKLLPPEVVNWICEEFTMEWASFSGFVTSDNRLFVNKEFGKIYDQSQCEGNFGSCMVNRGLHSFYSKYVNASAAYLEKDGKIIARCIIFNEIFDEDGNVYRYAERQYSSDGSDVLKRTLIDALIRGGHIDCYKQIGAGCHDTNAIVDIYGNSLSDKSFHIVCTAQEGNIHSYQDTFIYLSVYNEKAYNYDDVSYDYNLDTTYGRVGADDDDEDDDRPYDDFHDRYCDETTTVYVHGQEYNCDVESLDDFIEINGEYIYCEDVITCPECGSMFDKYERNVHKSKITDECYCCQSCMEEGEKNFKQENWYYSEYDEAYFEHEEDITSFMCYDSSSHTYKNQTISQESYLDLLDNGDLHWIGNSAFDKLDPNTNLPFGYEIHLSLAECLKLFNKNESVKEVV